MFASAADRSKVALSEQDIESLSQRVAFSLRVQPSLHTTLPRLVPRPVYPLSNRAAEQLAIAFRSALNLNSVEPLIRLPLIIEAAFNIFLFPKSTGPFSGGCALVDGCAFLFLSKDLEPHHQLLVCAHELAHLLLIASRGSEEPLAVLDPNAKAQAARTPIEYFADAFALQLLVPEEGLSRAASLVRSLVKASAHSIGDVELLYLSRIFGVSFLAIGKRCERAGMLPRGGAAALDNFLTLEFGDAERRAEDLDLPPRPTINIPNVPAPIEAATVQLIRNRELSIEEASAALSWLPADLACVWGLDSY